MGPVAPAATAREARVVLEEQEVLEPLVGLEQPEVLAVLAAREEQEVQEHIQAVMVDMGMEVEVEAQAPGLEVEAVVAQVIPVVEVRPGKLLLFLHQVEEVELIFQTGMD